MADSTIVGEVAVEVLARTESLEKGMKQAGNSVAEFSRSATEGTKKFSASMEQLEVSHRGANMFIRQATASFGAEGSAIAEVSHLAIALGPALGVVAAAFYTINRALEEGKKSAESFNKILDGMEKAYISVGQAMGRIRIEGFLEKEASNRIELINKNMRELSATLAEERSRMYQDYDAQKRIVDSLKEQSELYKEAIQLKKEARDTDVQNKQDIVDAANQKIIDDALKAQEKIEEGWRNTIEHMTKAVRTPGEILRDTMLDAFDALNHGLSDESFNRIAEKAKEAFAKTQQTIEKMVKPAEMVKVGFGTQLDNTRVSADAMRMAGSLVQKVTDPALELTNKLLGVVVEKVGSASIARAG